MKQSFSSENLKMNKYEAPSDCITDDDVPVRLLSFNNVIVISHQAFFTKKALENIAMTTLQNIKDFINHKPLLNEVKKENFSNSPIV